MNDTHRKKYYTGFISEHTAEYILVPALKNILEKRFSTVAPIFPWINREGGALSQHIHGGVRFMILGLFVKRPKYDFQMQEMQVKINDEFIRGARYGKAHGVPFILGCPVVRNLWEIGSCNRYLWINLNGHINDSYELHSDHFSNGTHENPINSVLLTENQILNLAIEETVSFNINDLKTFIKEIKRETGPYLFFGAGYRPIYFLLKE